MQQWRSAVVVGLGKTGLSVARHLHARGLEVRVTDSRASPPGLDALRALDARLPIRTGGFDTALLDGAQVVVVSPGVAPHGAFFDAARQRGLPLIGDIELFARAAQAPVAGITGTNGKSTVTTLLGNMAARAGRRVRVGGNLGEPALELLDPAAELYVLELSSYQLETTESLAPAVACVLNVTPDHLDRYGNLAAYAAAKARILRRAAVAIVNLDDPLVAAMATGSARRVGFTLQAVAGAAYHLTGSGAASALAVHAMPLLPLSQLRIAGRHNAANALAALALADALGLPRVVQLAELREFPGLPHRSQWVADIDGVRYVDDSKGTNVGATLAAVAGLDAPLLVIAGGDGKDQDFRPLAAAFRGKVRCALLIGRDAAAIATALAGACEYQHCSGLEAAVAAAARAARPGDTVLLSPACASFDMFRDYAHRGAVFAAAVRGLAA
ncbi:MAG: UDP-N-acetylmuramoyl-L-alanine--D-glutamate ligase [Gammaproteobacteria bacterium]|nr:UDP-N-acetylmuramoyl-L-alanine--D-glutamate ligase [Gammaproteobacteria bacterium]